MPTKKRKVKTRQAATGELGRVRAVDMRELLSPEDLVQHLWSVFHKNEFLAKEVEHLMEANEKLRTEKDVLIGRIAKLQSERRQAGQK